MFMNDQVLRTRCSECNYEESPNIVAWNKAVQPQRKKKPKHALLLFEKDASREEKERVKRTNENRGEVATQTRRQQS